jgi:putative spermidine/putrescine transport system substrate-binding protein
MLAFTATYGIPVHPSDPTAGGQAQLDRAAARQGQPDAPDIFELESPLAQKDH